MLKSYLQANDWHKLSLLSFYITILAGLLLRMQYSGYLGFLSEIDIRRFHSHLGFYGFLFPLLWGIVPAYGFWVPGRKLRILYSVLLIVSMIGFGLSGYGIVSHISSFFVLLIWLSFGFKNIRMSYKGDRWINAIPMGVILSAVIVLTIFILRMTGADISIPQVVRVFLTTLLFGVFGPLALENISKPLFSVHIWLIVIFGVGVFLSSLDFHIYFILFPVLAGMYLVLSFIKNVSFKKLKADRLYSYWLLFAVGLVGMSCGYIENNHFTAVAGIHYAVFLLVASAFIVFKNCKFRILYEIFSLLMVSLIYSQNIVSWSYLNNQISLAIVSAILVGLVYTGVSKLKC